MSCHNPVRARIKLTRTGFYFMDEQIITKIESVYEKDQESIKLFRAKKISLEELQKGNSQNVTFIIEVIEKYGFPFKNTASLKAYTAAFLAVQHSGNIELIEKVIDLFSKASEKQIEKKDLAYLIDRLKILKNLPQLYGTQYKLMPDSSVEFFEIEDKKTVDERRKQMGMESLEEYLSKIKQNQP